jgi:hypothetical protein
MMVHPPQKGEASYELYKQETTAIYGTWPPSLWMVDGGCWMVWLMGLLQSRSSAEADSSVTHSTPWRA